MLPDAAELQGRLQDAETQLQRWRIILEGAADCATPEDVLHLLNTLQQQHMEARVQVSAACLLRLFSSVDAGWWPGALPASRSCGL